MSNKVTHIVYSHHHADHLGASSLFGRDVTRIGQVETKRLLARDNDPTRPAARRHLRHRHTLRVGGERIDLAWHGTNHTPDNSYIHFPDHDTLMLVDIVLPGWVPYDSFNLNEDVPGSIAAPAKAMAYPWKHFIGGHMGRLGNRRDMVVYQQYVNDLIDGVKKALVAVDPTPFFANTATTPGPGSRPTKTHRSTTRPRRSSRSTPASSPPPTSTPPAPRSSSSNRSASTSASARRSTREEMSGSPRRAEGTDLGHDRRDVVVGRLLADLAVGDPVDVHRVPMDRLAVGRRPQQASLDRGDEPDDDQVVLGDDVLLGRVRVRQRPDERLQQAAVSGPAMSPRALRRR